MKFLQEVCSIPTAPFAEQHVVRYVEEFVRRRPKLRLSRDESGNMLIELPGRGRMRRPRWLFAAHIDHPGFVAEKMIDARTLVARFHGWVQIDYVRPAKVRFFDAGREVAGTVIEATSSTHDRLTVPDRVKVRLSAPVPAGAPGMFDLGIGRLKGRTFYCRGVDDSGGVAAALALLDALHQKPPASSVGVLLTRAEEEGL